MAAYSESMNQGRRLSFLTTTRLPTKFKMQIYRAEPRLTFKMQTFTWPLRSDNQYSTDDYKICRL